MAFAAAAPECSSRRGAVAPGFVENATTTLPITAAWIKWLIISFALCPILVGYGIVLGYYWAVVKRHNPMTPRFGSGARSSGRIAKCSLGLSRKYVTQAITHTRLQQPRTTNEPRHVTSAIRKATIGGVIALPRRAHACVIVDAR